jgi:hypothetical protein
MGRELFLFTNSKHYCVPDLFKKFGDCKHYIIKHHYKTQHNNNKNMACLQYVINCANKQVTKKNGRLANTATTNSESFL